eukprot:2586007-Pyramimonas_sp.AAC.1
MVLRRLPKTTHVTRTRPCARDFQAVAALHHASAEAVPGADACPTPLATRARRRRPHKNPRGVRRHSPPYPVRAL